MEKALAALPALGICALAACGGGTGGGTRQSSPQETARGYKEAVVRQDWEQSMGHLTRKAQADMVGLAYLTAAYGIQSHLALADSFAVLSEKHGLDRKKNAGLREADNLTEILVELVEWIEGHLPAESGGSAFADIAQQMDATEYSDFEIDGDVAHANWVSPERTRRVTFRKIDGRWLMET